MNFKSKTLLALVAAGSLAAGTAQAETFAANTFFAPQHPLAKAAFTDWSAAVKEATNGEIEFEVFAGGSLLPALASLEGTRNGVAQVTYHAGTYTPSDLPLTNVIADLSFLSPDPWVMAFASTEFNMTHPRLLEEWKRNNIVYGGGYSSIPYYLVCAKERPTLESLRGAKLRMPGGGWDRFATFIGATPVNVPGSEMYTGLERGGLDCAANGVDSLETFALWDVVGGVTLLDLGVYFSGTLYGLNADFWKDRTEEQRRILLDTMGAYVVHTTRAYVDSGEDAKAKAAEKGVALIEPDATLLQALADFAAHDREEVIRIAKERYHVENPEAFIAEFEAMIAKWQGLLEGQDLEDTEALIALVRSEIYNKIDAATYGLD